VAEALARLSSPVDVVVHLAALSALQACQDDPARALATNHPTIFWEALPNTTRVIAMSTDQVYDGFHPPYSEDSDTSDTSPINVYGETKLAMEQGLVHFFPQQCVILRSSLILGSPAVHSKKQSFVQFLETQLAEKKETNVFTDEYRSVVSVTNVVQVISYFLEHNESPGIYNMGGSESVNRWDIALAVHRQLWGDHHVETPSNLHGIERSKLPKQQNSAPSPPNITMDIGKLQTLLQSAGIHLWSLNDTIYHCNLSRPQL
jgi:dTDP-4-dehydrorhamnose reductase